MATGLEKAKGARDLLTAKFSDVARQVSFGGMATIWAIRLGAGGEKFPFTDAYLNCLVLFVLALACDVLQYFSAAMIYRFVTWFSFDEDLVLRWYHHVLPEIFFFGKGCYCIWACGRLVVVMAPGFLSAP